MKNDTPTPRKAATENALAKYDPRQYQVLTRPEDLVSLSDYVRIDVVAVELGECADVGGGKMMPARDATDRIAAAAGVQFVESGCSVEKLDAMTWVGRATAKRMNRDGTWTPAVAEYEWDASLRAEEIAGKDAVEWVNRQKTYRPKTDADRAWDLLQMRKFGRQRADTGARMRVIRILAGIPTAFKKEDVRRPLVVHRASLDARAMAADPAVRGLLVEKMLGARDDVFGPPTMRDVTPEPKALPDAPETPLDEETAGAVADKIVDDEVSGGGFVPAEAGAEPFTEDEQAGVEDAFGDGGPGVAELRAWLTTALASGRPLKDEAREIIQAALEMSDLKRDMAQGLKDRTKRYWEAMA